MMRWSFKEQRCSMEIAAAAKSFDEVVKRTGRNQAAVRKAALQLGLKLGKQTASDNRLAAALKAKAK
jgi:hypothetical protein